MSRIEVWLSEKHFSNYAYTNLFCVGSGNLHVSQHSRGGLTTTWRHWRSPSILWSWVRNSGTQPQWQLPLHIEQSQQWLRILIISKLKFKSWKSNFLGRIIIQMLSMDNMKKSTSISIVKFYTFHKLCTSKVVVLVDGAFTIKINFIIQYTKIFQFFCILSSSICFLICQIKFFHAITVNIILKE